LGKFLAEAVVNTWVGEGKKVSLPWMPDSEELEYPENGWIGNTPGFYYRDSYAGYYLVAGREVVYLNGVPVWCRLYSGGMEPAYREDQVFAEKTFDFLKRALLQFNRDQSQKRGPEYYAEAEGKLEYSSWTKGDITRFNGDEWISLAGKKIFSLSYSGCLILPK
jgi:hypothetical protein